MTSLRVLLSRLADVVVRGRRDRRLDDEIQTHLDLLAAEFVRRGMTPAEARLAARRSFGGVDQLKSVYRDQRGLPVLDALGQDVRFAFRLLRRDRGFALTALFVLAVGIGVNNMLFTILNAHTLRGLPIPAAHRVAAVANIDGRTQNRGVSYPDFEELRRSGRSFAGMMAMTNAPAIVTGDGRAAERIEAAYIAGNALSITGRQPVLGRAFSAEDERPGAAAVAVIGTGLWQERYSSDPAVLGRPLVVDGVPAAIVGVMDDRSGLPTTAPLWMPLARLPGPTARARSDRTLRVFGRLRDDVTFDGAAAEIRTIMSRLARDHPDTNSNLRAEVAPINEQYFGRWDEPVWFAFMTVGFIVVIISSANVANLLLARAIVRTREMAIRSSIGASRARIIRQLLIEGLVLAAIGGTIGLGLAMLGVQLLRAAIPANTLPYWIDYSPDRRVIAALIAVSLGTVLVFALVPAIQGSKADVNRVLKDGGRTGSPGRGAQRWTMVFLAAEFALAIVLLGQVAVALRSSTSPPPSDAVVETKHVLTASVTLAGSRYQSPGQRRQFYRLLRERLEGAADVTGVSVTTAAPFAGGPEARVAVAGRPLPAPGDRPAVRTIAAGPAYFQTLALPLLRGREFVDADGDDGSAVAIVNQEFARRFLDGSDPLSQRIAIAANGTEATPEWLAIVGIAPDIRQRRGDVEPIVYTPYFRDPSATATLLVRSEADGGALMTRITDTVAELDPNLPLYRTQTLADAIWAAQWNGRVSNRMILTLTLIATLLSTIGLYGVTVHGIRQRTHEIGVRMALGARPLNVAAMLVRRTAIQLGFGFFAGIVCTRLWEGSSPRAADAISASDPQSLLIVAAVLVVLAALACAVPVRRATRLDPVAAIRHE